LISSRLVVLHEVCDQASRSTIVAVFCQLVLRQEKFSRVSSEINPSPANDRNETSHRRVPSRRNPQRAARSGLVRKAEAVLGRHRVTVSRETADPRHPVRASPWASQSARRALRGATCSALCRRISLEAQSADQPLQTHPQLTILGPCQVPCRISPRHASRPLLEAGYSITVKQVEKPACGMYLYLTSVLSDGA
jgi:hypothetical protein